MDDGAAVVQNGGVFGVYVDLDGTVRGEAELVNKYREISEDPEVESAVDDVVNEAIVIDDVEDIVQIDLDNVKFNGVDAPEKIKKIIEQEFEEALKLLKFNSIPYETFKRWYIDGRVYFHAVIDPKRPQLGVQELRYIDPRKIRKIREIKKVTDPASSAKMIETVNEYYIFNDKGFNGVSYGAGGGNASGFSTGIKIAKDSIVQCTSGITSSRGDMILSYLHKAIRPLNMIRSMEDSLVIYRVSRSAERRVFYVDVGNMPKMKAEQYLRDTMVKFKNKVVYDSSTGSVRDDRKFQTMLEDFWLPRREGGKGTEITTLPGGQNLGQMDDVLYFKKNLYRSLNVPITRIDPDAMFNYGRTNELTRDELKFAKFITRLRSKFAILFTRILERQLVLKGIMSIEEFHSIADDIKYNFARDNYIEEIKQAEIYTERLNILGAVMPFVGRFFSNKWVQQNVLHQTEEEMEKIREEIIEEMSDPLYAPPEGDDESQQQRGFTPPEPAGAGKDKPQ